MARNRGYNRIPGLQRLIRRMKFDMLDKIGEFCVERMDDYVPVRTGFLRNENKYIVIRVEEPSLRLVNEALYALFVEFGTYKMHAQPFMRPSLFNHVSEINSIIGSIWNFNVNEIQTQYGGD